MLKPRRGFDAPGLPQGVNIVGNHHQTQHRTADKRLPKGHTHAKRPISHHGSCRHIVGSHKVKSAQQRSRNPGASTWFWSSIVAWQRRTKTIAKVSHPRRWTSSSSSSSRRWSAPYISSRVRSAYRGFAQSERRTAAQSKPWGIDTVGTVRMHGNAEPKRCQSVTSKPMVSAPYLIKG